MMAGYVFPPALVRLIRERLTPKSWCLFEVTDDELVQLLTTIFFAGLETYEGDHYAISVAFIGRNADDLVMTEDAAAGVLPLYRWKILRFAAPRQYAPRELVKLAVAGGDRRIHCAVGVLEDGTLGIVGLAREGFSTGSDPFIKIVASRPGCLSIRSGRDLILEYERGTIVTVDDDGVFTGGAVHRALRTIARSAGVDEEVVPRYVDAVGFLVREIVAHATGGILIISAEQQPAVAESAPYRMALNSSLAALLRLGWRAGVGGSDANHPPSEAGVPAFNQLLRNAFLTEAERVVEEFGRLTAIDGAVLLNRDLALMAFGVILPVGQPVALEHAGHGSNGGTHVVEFGSRGTRHRAAATYAADHPRSVVFVASEVGLVSCMFRERSDAPVRLWWLAAGTAHVP